MTVFNKPATSSSNTARSVGALAIMSGAEESACTPTTESEPSCQPSTFKLPRDTFSLFLLSKNLGPAFIFSISIFIFQVGVLCLVMKDLLDIPPGSPPLNCPPGVSNTVRISQFCALAIALATQDDIITSINFFFDGYFHEPLWIRLRGGSGTRFLFSNICRFAEGFLGLGVSMIIIIQSSEVMEMFANFAAMAFISHIDNVAFELAASGYISDKLQKEAENVLQYKFPKPSAAANIRRRLTMLTIFIVMVSVWAWFASEQNKGEFLSKSISVQIGDDEVPYYSWHSGIYEIAPHAPYGRYAYLEKNANGKERGIFMYCKESTSWVFVLKENVDLRKNMDDVCKNAKLHSMRTASFDPTAVPGSGWSVRSGKDFVPLSFFTLSSNDCGTDEDCNAPHGLCVDNSCSCKPNRFGPKCEFQRPCRSIQTDQGKGFNDFFADNYVLLKNQDGQMVSVYGQPVYFHDYSSEKTNGLQAVDVIMFTGRRWVVTDTSMLPELKQQLAMHGNMTVALTEYFNTFHSGSAADWSFQFISEPSEGGTPVGLSWHKWVTFANLGREGNSLGIMDNTDALLVCSRTETIDAEGNIGKNCTAGYSGSFCHIPPVQGSVTMMFRYMDGRACESCGVKSFTIDLKSPWTLFPYDPLFFGEGKASQLGLFVNETNFVIYHTSDPETFNFTWHDKDPFLTPVPTPLPTNAPSAAPSSVPTTSPSAVPSASPTAFPSASPTVSSPNESVMLRPNDYESLRPFKPPASEAAQIGTEPIAQPSHDFITDQVDKNHAALFTKPVLVINRENDTSIHVERTLMVTEEGFCFVSGSHVHENVCAETESIDKETCVAPGLLLNKMKSSVLIQAWFHFELDVTGSRTRKPRRKLCRGTRCLQFPVPSPPRLEALEARDLCLDGMVYNT